MTSPLSNQIPIPPLSPQSLGEIVASLTTPEGNLGWHPKYERMEELTLTARPKRRFQQPVFKIRYDTYNDIRMRLEGTIVFVGPTAYYVQHVYVYQGEFWLCLSDGVKGFYKVRFSSEGLDLRSPEPQYIVVEDRPYFLMRQPRRQQQQGLSPNNSLLKPVGSNDTSRLHNWAEALPALSNYREFMWSPQYADLMIKAKAFTKLRLSGSVAFFVRENELMSEYKGRCLGPVKENVILLDEFDSKRPWIKRDIQQIGCEVGRA